MLESLGARAKAAALAMMTLQTGEKNRILEEIAKTIEEKAGEILDANAQDVLDAKANGISDAFLDRLTLNGSRIEKMAEALRDVARLPDPTGGGEMLTRPNGLKIERIRVPLGVIGIIYEARPNVTLDAIGLCIKSGNAVLLRGGKEAIRSNVAITRLAIAAGERAGLPAGAIGIVEDTSRETAARFMQLNDYLDVLIPRGGAGLIDSVIKNSTVPVIETGKGNCHAFVDVDASFEKAVKIIVNAKCQRPAVCNAIETMLVSRSIAEEFLPKVMEPLRARGVEIRGCRETCELYKHAVPAQEADYYEEFDELILAVKIVGGATEAISHINAYGTKHSEVIVTENYTTAQRFLREVDAAAVYVNASTRFTDGGEFGMGAEIGISTQKLHARGPMGLRELTSIKYLIYGDGQTI